MLTLQCDSRVSERFQNETFVVDSCHSTWEFDPVKGLYRRHIKDTKRADVYTDWRPYFGVYFLEPNSESFVVLLNETGTRLIRSYSHTPGCTACGDQATTELNVAEIANSPSAG